MKTENVMHSYTREAHGASRGFFNRAFRRLRLPMRNRTGLELAAAQGRALRLFEVNFKSKWNR